MRASCGLKIVMRAKAWWTGSLAAAVLLTACRTSPPVEQSAPRPPDPPRVEQSAQQAAEARALIQKVEQVRNACVEGRRRICGQVLQVSADGLVVDSGYTDLLRPELANSWVLPSSVSASRPPNLLEEKSPGSVCVGLVLVTATPKRPPVKPYDYVVIGAYPAGETNCVLAPNVTKTLRRFSVELEAAIQLNLDAVKK